MLTTILKKYKNTFYPIIGEPLTSDNSIPLDLSINNETLMALDLSDDKKLETYIFNILEKKHVPFGFGGYGEHRILYSKSDMFHSDHQKLVTDDARCIHLGIDIWGKVGTPIYAPMDGKIHSFQYNTGYLDYGATIILEHQIEEVTFYTLYGHLDLNALKDLSKGQRIEKGCLLAHFGDYPENGGWAPHLHFQLIRDLLGCTGDFIGVASKKEADYYLSICPNPSDLIVGIN